MTDDLPKPHDGMTPEEKGKLLLRYLKVGQEVARWRAEEPGSNWDALDFSETDLMEARLLSPQLSGASLSSAKLDASSWEGGSLARSCLQRASLRLASLAGTTLYRADLRYADLSSGVFRDVDLSHADLRESLTYRTTFWGCNIAGASPPKSCGVALDFETFLASGSNEDEILKWVSRGATLIDLRAFPDSVQAAAASRIPGLTLFLSTRLLPWDQTMLHAFACSVLGIDTNVRVAEYAETGKDSCRVRLVGPDPNDLVAIAEHVSNVTWKTERRNALQAAGMLQVDAVRESLDNIRQHLEKQELWADKSGVREMLEDQAAKDIAEKDVRLVRTWGNKLLRAGWETATKKAGKEIVGEVEDGVKGLLGGWEDE